MNPPDLAIPAAKPTPPVLPDWLYTLSMAMVAQYAHPGTNDIHGGIDDVSRRFVVVHPGAAGTPDVTVPVDPPAPGLESDASEVAAYLQRVAQAAAVPPANLRP